MTWDVIDLYVSALSNLPEREVLGEVDRWINTYLIHDFEIINVIIE